MVPPLPEGSDLVSRLYAGQWRVLVVWDAESGEEFIWTEPDTYFECEKVCFMLGLSVPFEGHRVKRALIVPVAQ
jgi:hypothetical protein